MPVKSFRDKEHAAVARIDEAELHDDSSDEHEEEQALAQRRFSTSIIVVFFSLLDSSCINIYISCSLAATVSKGGSNTGRPSRTFLSAVFTKASMSSLRRSDAFVRKCSSCSCRL